jgi:hypothetical protein
MAMDKKVVIISWVICIVSVILAIAAFYYAHITQIRIR